MRYARVKKDHVSYWRDNRVKATVPMTARMYRTALSVKGELLTPSEYKKRRLPEKAVEWVELPKTRTFWSFGARFECKEV